MSDKIAGPVAAGAAPPTRPGATAHPAAGGKVEPAAGNTSPQQSISSRAARLSELVRELNARSRSLSPALRFRVDMDAGTSIIQVFDRDTGELIREIPEENARSLARSGGLIDLDRLDDFI